MERALALDVWHRSRTSEAVKTSSAVKNVGVNFLHFFVTSGKASTLIMNAASQDTVENLRHFQMTLPAAA